MNRLVILLAALGLGACTTPVTYDGPPLGKAELPTLRPGDTLTWSGGYSETVTAVDGDVVSWQDDHGNTFRSYRNFLLPSLAWDYPRTRAATEIHATPDLLWPLEKGKRAWFDVRQRLTIKVHASEVAYTDEWMCDVQGTEAVTVPLGTFDTWRLRCARFWRGSNLGEVVWNYAPALEAVVRRRYPGQDHADELVALRKGRMPVAAGEVAGAIRQTALEKHGSGKDLRLQAGGMAVSVTPRATWKTDAGGWCRSLTETVADGDGSLMRVATACRDRDGRWQVVSAAQPW